MKLLSVVESGLKWFLLIIIGLASACMFPVVLALVLGPIVFLLWDPWKHGDRVLNITLYGYLAASSVLGFSIPFVLHYRGLKKLKRAQEERERRALSAETGPLDDEGGRERRGRGYLFGCLGCAGAMVAYMIVLIILVCVKFGGFPSPPDVPFPTEEVERQKVFGFTFEVSDPAAYWGKYSAVGEVDSPRFDAILYNSCPDQMAYGCVVVGLRSGKTDCFYIRAIGLHQIVVNGKAFDWEDSSAHPLTREEILNVAWQLTQNEVEDLQELSRLLSNDRITSGMYDRAGFSRGARSWAPIDIGGFSSQVKEIAAMKQQLAEEERVRTKTEKLLQNPFKDVPREVQEQKLSGFSSDVMDPAVYWGKYSAVVKVESGQFDQILLNPFPDQLVLGSVALGMRGGKIVCFYIDLPAFHRFVVNGKAFDWQRLGEANQAPQEQVLEAAKQLTDSELADLRELSRLFSDEKISREIYDRSGFWSLSSIARFKSDVEAIAASRQKLANEERRGTSKTELEREEAPY